MMTNVRVERDSLGEVEIPDIALWGPQTQRCLENFKIGTQMFPEAFIRNFLILKKACAIVNAELGVLDAKKSEYIVQAVDKILANKDLMEAFPLKIWQTGSGTQLNMNVNEVISHVGNQLAGEKLLHPNDDVNRSQSSNDTFPTVMQMTIYEMYEEKLLPELLLWEACLMDLSKAFGEIKKIGRTHLQDATPITFGEELDAWRSMIVHNCEILNESKNHLLELGIGGTAVGNGINTPPYFAEKVVDLLSELLGFEFVESENKFYQLSSHSQLAQFHGAMTALATDVNKIVNDIRWLASGPRCGLGEITIPSNEPGSSIMPGKVNPTQAEALTMIVARILGNETTVQFANSQGHFQLNTFKPVILYAILETIDLLADGMKSFRTHCLAGLHANEVQMERNYERSLMLITYFTPVLGYSKCAEVAKYAFEKEYSVKEALLSLDLITEDEYDEIMQHQQ